jgi:peptide/nickel transport system permease protein
MAKFILQRALYALVTLALASVIVFIIIQLPPGDYADAYAWSKRESGLIVTEEEVEILRRRFGLDRPLYEQYWIWITNIVLHGDFGVSCTWGDPVLEIIGERIGFTTILALATLIFTYGLAIPIGIYSAVRQYSAADYATTVIGYIGLAMPNFMLALILLYISVMVFDTSVGGLFSPEFQEAPWSWARALDMLKHLWVPVIVLGTAGTAFQIRTMRATTLDEQNKLYVTAARACC